MLTGMPCPNCTGTGCWKCYGTGVNQKGNERTEQDPPRDADLAHEKPYAYGFRLAKSIIHHDDGRPSEYTNWDREPRLSLTPPNVPPGSIKDYVALYARPMPDEEKTDG